MNGNLYHNRKAQWAIYIVVFVLLALVPFVFDNPFNLNQFARYLIFSITAVSVSLVWGYGGILSLGQGIAFGMGAYGMAATMQMQFQDPENDPIPTFMLTNELEKLPLVWEPFWSTPIGLALALGVPTLFFLFFGYMMFQARVVGVFVAIMTLAMLAAWYSVVYDMQPFTAGFNGISPPNAFEIFGTSIDPYSATAYWICVAFLVILTLSTKFLLGTKFGLIVQAMRDDPERARFLGYSVAYYQTVLFTISGFIAACAGILWVMVTQYVSPTSMEIMLSISMVIWAAVGGRTSLLGAIIGAFLINLGQSYAGDEFQQHWLIILGVVFVIVVLFLPKGLTGLFESILGKFSGNKNGADSSTGQNS
ncbi:MAG: urea ABC transporter permease subunit UrtC [Gammaproteobacteria bacterium]|nr:MAG: urea ABC transporter permease subunit UrtC [Gammaproteobacteria bacterium]